MAKTRISFVITGLGQGGAEAMLVKLLSVLDRSRFDPSVICLGGPGFHSKSIESLGIQVHHLNIPEGRWSLTGLRTLIQILRAYRPHLLQGWMYHGNLAAHAARLLGRLSVPVLWNIRGTHTTLANESNSTALTIWLGAKLSRHVHTVVNNSAVSMRMHIEQLGYFRGNVVVIPNGFDTDRFHPNKEARSVLADRLRLDPQCRLVGHIARLHPMKDHTSLLRAAALLLDGRADTHFILVGDGLTTSSVVAGLADALGIRDRVHFLGSLGDVSAFLPGLDLVVLTSAYGEGFSNAIGEAMACGVPCLVTDVGDSAWIVGDSGEVVAPRDVVAIARGMDKLLSLPRERLHAMGEQARKRIVENFSISAITSRYEDLYSRAAVQSA